MRLKSLQIKGFKSFANDTILHFQDDVIGIVGPNGSGKSNIVDAIRWVLGEQKSKELRLESMGDVIFNGTKSKKEAAAAMVALTFENTRGVLPSEYQFVTISRTLYRSGESEYRLNNVVCRLKDITSLFVDTGIGSNSYAIIALGMVDDILENKENARRRMFEQAAGVSKYKMRKKETLQKLKNTEEDLNRIEDLLFEIDGNVKTLEKQAKRTQKYNEIKQKYKESSIQHAVYSIQSLKEKYKSIAETLRVQQDLYRENDTAMLKVQAQLEKEKKLNLDKEVALNEKQKRMNELVSKIRSLENEKVLLNQKSGFTQKAQDNLKRTLTETEQNIETLKNEIVHLTSRIEKENIISAQYSETLEKSKALHLNLREKYSLVKSEFDEKQKQLMVLEKEQYELEKEIAILKNTGDNLEIEWDRIHEAIDLRQKNNVEIQSGYESLVAEINKKSTEHKKLLSSEEERLVQIEKNEKNAEVIREKLSQVNRALDSKQNEFDLLKSMIENFEGYPESIKFLHDNWKKDPVILGDILDVDEDFKGVIELYLDQYLNYFVVEEVADAYKAIQLLSKAQRGKANFFINNQLDPTSEVKDKPQGLIPAIQHVKIEPKYKNLLNHLLKDCYIFDGDVSSMEFLEDRKNDYVILSKDGHFIKTRKTISGGSIGLFEGKKIGRKKNLDHLAKNIQDYIQQKSQLEKDQEVLQQTLIQLKNNRNKEIVQALAQEINSLQQKMVKAQVQLDEFQKFQEEQQGKLSDIKSQKKKLEIQKEEKYSFLSLVQSKVQIILKTDDKGDSELTQLSESLSKASEQFNQDTIQMIRHQNLLENLQKELEYKNTRSVEHAQKFENDRYRLLAEEKAMIDIRDELNQLDASLVTFYEEKKRYNASLSESEQAYFQTKNAINDLDDQIRKYQKEQNALQYQIQQLKDDFTELKFKISGVGERLRIEFNIPVNDIINQEPEPGIDYEVLGEEIEKLKNRIANYGEINPLALEAYNEMNERYQKIVQQKNDIVSAKDSLLETIREIESTATKQFYEAFETIRANFIKVFRELFTDDDTCDLVLENPDNPLESEIEIVAKPKGKKPKSISQLSGGEKTLTATALLFALYLLKPAPFCIFDEVDAPLDDANIQKFNKIIQKFSKDSQFIIVTHNKSTMVEVDILYGVYMQEPGVSAVSAVDFKKIQQETVGQ